MMAAQRLLQIQDRLTDAIVDHQLLQGDIKYDIIGTDISEKL